MVWVVLMIFPELDAFKELMLQVDYLYNFVSPANKILSQFLFLLADHMTISVLELGIAVVNQPANRRRTKCSCSFSKYIWDRENDNLF